MRTKNNIKAVYVGAKIPQKLRILIGSALNSGAYLNLSEFVRIAVKEKLGREGFLSIEEM